MLHRARGRSRKTVFSCCLILGLAVWGAAPAGADDLGSARLLIAGTRLAVTPESQTVPFNTPTIVETQLQGYDPSLGTLPGDLRVLADFTGPEIDGILTLETRPNEPFRIPRLSLKGQYQLDNIRLVQGDELLAYAAPRSAGILVTQVLVTRVTSRALTLDEIRSYGIVADDESFRAFSFTFGFAVDGEVVDYNLPVLFSPVQGDPVRILSQGARLSGGGSTGTTAVRFRPPQLAPFQLELESSGGGSGPTGGCTDPMGNCRVDDPVSLPGVILFPTDVSLLNQFFSVVLVAKNDAPEGDPLTIRDLTAKVTMPPGLRQAETEPPTPLGVPVPVRVPGPDGRLGTGDDVTFLVAQAEGQAEVLVEGVKEGTHVVDFDLSGVLEGLPGGRIERVTGQARGAVVVRDPTLGITITHPDTVRVGEEYSLLLTLANTSNAPVNLVTVDLPPSGISGAELLSSSSRSIPTLLPGESELVEFQLRSQRTGRVVATSVKSGSKVDPSFELTMGVGELGIPLSPTALILPRAADVLPQTLKRSALTLLGLGYSLATAPADLLDASLPSLDTEGLTEKVYELGQAGRHVDLGEDPFDAVSVLAAEWTGVRQPDWGWDDLRRSTQKGGNVGDAVAQVLAAEAAATSPRSAFERFAATTVFLGPIEAAVGEGSGVEIEVSSRTSGRSVYGGGLDPLRLRDLPFADLYDLGTAQMALMAVPEDGGYQVRMADADGGTQALEILVPDASGALRVVRWSNVSLSPSGLAVADFEASFADTDFTLFVDADGDGVVESQLPGTVSTLAPRPFTAVAAVQNVEDPSGHIVEILLTRDVDLASLLPRDPGRFTIPGKVSNGGLIPTEADLANFFQTIAENPFEGLRNTRIVRVIFNNPISPLVTNNLTVRDLASVDGAALSNVVVPVQTRITTPGGQVTGTVIGPDGGPVPFARVELFETDLFIDYPDPCRRHKVAAVQADAAGTFTFDFVRTDTGCSEVFLLQATDPVTGQFGEASGRVRLAGETKALDVVMLGRGTIRGRVVYDDGTVPETPQVIAYSPVFFEGREATITAEGIYEVGDVPVGTVSLGASDRQGNFVFQTVEIPTAGAVVERDLVILRQPEEIAATGDVRGVAVEADGVTPVFNAYVALYVDGELVGVERSGVDGTFDFGTVPAGRAEIEAFDGETGLAGAQVTFDVLADQVNQVTLILRDERGTVEGHVYRQTLDQVEPVVGAVVWVSGTPFNAVTDASGFFRIEGVFAGSRTVMAADLERQTQVSAGITISDGVTVTRDLYFVELVDSGLAGEVLGFTGNPVPGATVHIAAGPNRWWGEAFADFNGRFVFPDLAPGTYELHAVSGSAGGVATGTIRFEGETPFVRIQFKKGTIRGQTRAVDSNGQEVGVVSLVTYRTTVVQDGMLGLDYEPHTIETAADGSFEIPDVLTGPYTLTVSNAFHGEKTIHDELVLHGDVHEHDVEFQRNGEIRGRVLDWDGETPVQGATVRLNHPNFSIFDLTTDENGEFNFGLVPPGGRFPIDVEYDDGAVFRKARGWVRFDQFGQELDVELVLPMQGTVTGIVEDANGGVVPGAVVTLKEHGHPRRTIVQNADGEGEFRFTNVFAGSVSVSVKAPSLGGLASTAHAEILAEGQEVPLLLSLEGTGEVVGQVFSPFDGLPVPSAQVALYLHGQGLFDSVTADELGGFRFPLLPMGQYRVWVLDPATGRHGSTEGAWVEFNGHVRTANVTLESRGEADGHLTEPGVGGAVVPGATVRMTTQSLVPLTTYASTDVDGYFEFLGVPEGTFSLRTREPAGRRRASGSGEITFEDQRVTVGLVLEATGSVTGTLLNPAGAPAGPFANGNVLIEQDGQVVGATLDNPYTFDGIIANRPFRLRAREVGGDHRGTASGSLTTQGETVTVDVTIEPIGSLLVTVLDSFGQPVSGAGLSATSSGFYGRQSFSASTDAGGQATFTGVGAGSLAAYATHPVNGLKGSISGSLSLEGEQAALTVTLEDSGSVSGTAVLSDGTTPAADALVVITRGSRTLQTLADANGAFQFPSVPLGSFEVFVQEHFGPGTVEVSGSVDANGPAVALGTLLLDDHDPRVVELTPESGSRDLPTTTQVTVTFSEPVDVSRFSTSWFRFRKLSGAGVSYSTTWLDGNTKAVLTPALTSFTGYEVLVQDAYDAAGRRLFEKARTVFYTRDEIPPDVVDVLPRDGESQIEVDAEVLVTFSEPVDVASLSGAAIQLKSLTGGQGVSTTFQVLPGNRQVRLTPVGGLQTDTRYQLTVENVADPGGNVMAAPVTTTFWTVDTIPPVITGVSFPAGTDFVSGDDVPVSVSATDERGVAQVTVIADGWRFPDPDQTGPWDVTILAPVVSTAGTVTLTVEAVDVFGNVGTTTATVQVSPRSNANPPTHAALCGVEGGAAVPGVESEYALKATDDEAIEGITFAVDGVELDRQGPFNTPEASASFPWTPPAGAAPGTTWTIRLEARDFAGKTTTRNFQVTAPTGTVLPFGRSLDETYADQELILTNGTYLLRAPLSLPKLHVVRGATLGVPGASSPVDLNVGGLLEVQCGASIDGTGGGYRGGTVSDSTGVAPEGVTPSGWDAGGSHGGLGRVNAQPGPVGEIFDSVYAPQLAGGGGGVTPSYGGTDDLGTGGSAVRLRAEELFLGGDVLARGDFSDLGGGGGGGALWIETPLLHGGGLLDASGGDTRDCTAGGGTGGGGRIALDVGSLEGFEPTIQVRAHGGALEICNGSRGWYAGTGSVYVRTADDTYGTLIVDNGEVNGSDRGGAPLELPLLGSGAVTLTEVAGADLWVTGASEFLPRWRGAWMVLSDTGGTDLGGFRVAEVDATGRARLEGAAAVSGAAVYRGEYRFDRLELRNRVGLTAQDPVVVTDLTTDAVEVLDAPIQAGTVTFGPAAGPIRLGRRLEATDVVVQSGAVVSPLSGGKLDLAVSGTLTIEAGAELNASAEGFGAGLAPAGVTPSTPDSGGSHGGVGSSWHGLDTAGDTFDSVYEPQLSGGGGGYSEIEPDDARGGGAVHLDVGTLVLDGQILARGEDEDRTSRPGGAGGSVLVRATTVRGSGLISVTGGLSHVWFSDGVGAGGGGRVALHIDTFDGFDPVTQVFAAGAAHYGDNTPWRAFGYAGPGTIYVFEPSMTYGTLRIDNLTDADGNSRNGPKTVFPSLGGGTVTAFEVSGSDAWVSDASPFRERWLGVWMELLDGAGASLGTFRVADLDATGRALLEGASAVTGAATYRGEYRFDSLELLNGAGLVTTDTLRLLSLSADGSTGIDGPVEVETLVIGPGTTTLSDEIAATNVLVQAGATVKADTTGRLDLTIPGTLTVEAGALLEANAAGYGARLAPPGVAPSTPESGGSHGGVGASWQGLDTAGDTFDSVFEPQLGGGGGGYSETEPNNARGGGVVHLDVGTLVLEGEIRARGEDEQRSDRPAGAGGSVLIRASTVRGAGKVYASGGLSEVYFSDAAGSGGGGRVALYVDLFDGFDPTTQAFAHGGSMHGANWAIWGYAGAGTVYVFQPGMTHGTLRIDNLTDSDGNPRNGPKTVLPSLGTGTVTAFEVSGSDAWVSDASPFPERWLGVWMELLDGAGASLGTFRVADLDTSGRVLLAGAGTVTGAATYRGEYRFDSLELLNGAGLVTTDVVRVPSLSTLSARGIEGPVEVGTLTIGSGTTTLSADVAATDVVVQAGATVKANSSGRLDLTIPGTLTVEAGAQLTASAAGYGARLAPAGVAASTPESGGSHGGVGASWQGLDTAGDTFDSVYEPSLGGGGGGYSETEPNNARGGGVVHLDVGTLVLEGEIRARGEDEQRSSRPAGAGGSVVLHASTVRGAGMIVASGGLSEVYFSDAAGSGGGGRIALYVDLFDGFDPATQAIAHGGSMHGANWSVWGYAGAGTVYVMQPGMSYGELRVDNRKTSDGSPRTGPKSFLPSIGQGVVGVADADAADPANLWIEPQDSTVVFSLGVTGMWVRVEGVDYRVLDEDSASRRRILLEGAAGTVQVGDAYLGIYKFDTVTVVSGAQLGLADADDFGTLVIDADSSVTFLDYVPPSVTVTSPAAGTLFASGDPISITADVTDDRSGVAQVVFTLDDQSFTDTEAPWEWTVAAPSVTVEQDVTIDVQATDVEGNVASVDHVIRVRPLAPGDPPVVAVTCPTTGALVAPGTALDLHVTATHDNGIERVDLFLGSDPTSLDTDFDAPYVVRLPVPATAVEGDVLAVTVRAQSFTGQTADMVVNLPVLEGAVIAADTTLAEGDVSLDGGSVIVAGGTLTVDGPHTFRDLVVLDGATVTHPATSGAGVERLDVDLTRDLYVACGGAVDVSGRGYPVGISHPNDATEASAVGVGGSHGGRGGGFDGSNRVYGNLFDPNDPGAGGGGSGAQEGGGVARVAVFGTATVDGVIRAGGDGSATAASGAGGSIRLDAATLQGAGSLDASGGGSTASQAAGGGGRIALYVGSVTDAFLGRTTAAGGDAGTSSLRGAAGTVFVKRDTQTLGDLILDNLGRVSDQLTELLAVGSGAVDQVTTDGFTDAEADFLHTLAGQEVFFNGVDTTLWTVTDHAHHGQDLTLDVSAQALTAQAGDTYEGLYRFDRVIVRGGAQGLTRSRLDSATVPEIETGSTWSSGYAPSITLTSPTAGSSVVSGSTVSIAAQADSALGVRDVTFHFAGSSFTDATAPYAWSPVAPSVVTATDYEIRAVATDLSGHTFETGVTIQVTVNSDPTAPTVTLVAGCPADGDRVIPGTPVTLTATLSDNDLVAGYTFTANGVVIENVTAFDQPSATVDFTWTPPADQPGTAFVLRVEARDYGGNVTAAERTFHTPATLLTGSQSLDSTLNGQDVTLGAGTFTVTEPLDLAGMYLTDGTILTSPADGSVQVKTSGSMRVQCGAVVNVDGKGYEGGTSASPNGGAPPWMMGAQPDAGGSHGGRGTAYNAGPTDDVYGSVYEPSLAGGGGALDNDGSGDGYAGGGVIDLEVAELVLNGDLRVHGINNLDQGHAAGAGGTVRITTGLLTGTGMIDAQGGYASDGCTSSRQVGSGGGGRVALRADQISGFDVSTQVLMLGGARINCHWNNLYERAAAGTLFVKTAAATHGDLWVIQDPPHDQQAPLPTELPVLGTGPVTAFEETGADAWVTSSEIFRPRWEGAYMVLLDSVGTDLGTFRVQSVDAGGRALLEGAGAVTGAVGYGGEYHFDNVKVLWAAGLSTSDPLVTSDLDLTGASHVSGPIQTSNVTIDDDGISVIRVGDLQADSVTVKAGATVRPVTGSEIRWTLTGTLTVEAGAKIDVRGFGLAGGTPGSPQGGAPAWVQGSQPDAGGSHGGRGVTWDGAGPAGEVYDSVYAPQLAGGGGALDDNGSGDGSAGGGVLVLDVGDLVLDGTLDADGEQGNDNDHAGGAGGAVAIRANTLSGTGWIRAAGGVSRSCSSSRNVGSGGGGRVALEVDQLVGFDPVGQMKVFGGGRANCSWSPLGYASAGTIYLKTLGSTYGELIIDNWPDGSGNGRTAAPTELPALGTGSVATFTPEGTDVWVEGSAAFLPRWEGAWMALVDGSGVDLGVFRVAALDGAGRALLEGASTVTGAVTYRGEYRFDRVRVRRGAGLSVTDPLITPDLDVEGANEILGPLDVTDLVIEAGDKPFHTDGSFTASTVTVTTGAVVQPLPGSDTLRLAFPGTLTVEANAKINVDGLGYSGGTSASPEGSAPSGIQGASSDAGGSHGGSGIGWNVAGSAGDVFDSVYVPRLGGGGGALDDDGSGDGYPGGGILEVIVDNLVLDGSLLARGTNSDNAGRPSGGGGTIFLQVGSLAGTGSINATGGRSQSSSSSRNVGSGGGGRVALYVDDYVGFDVESQVLTAGASNKNGSWTPLKKAAGGTLYMFQPGMTFGELWIDGGSEAPNLGGAATTELPSLGTGSVVAFTPDGADAWVEGPAAFLPRWEGAWMALVDGSGVDLGVFRVAMLDGAGRALLEGAGTVTGAVDYRGEYHFDRVRVRRAAGLSVSDPLITPDLDLEDASKLLGPIDATVVDVSGSQVDLQTDGAFSTGSITVRSGAVVKPAPGSDTLRLAFPGTLTVEANAKINVDGLGYSGGTSASPEGSVPSGIQGASSDAGGSHGGAGIGWNVAGSAGDVFDSVYVPRLGGGGGALDDDGSGDGYPGGGILEVIVDNLVLDGSLLARGTNSDNAGRPSGGGGTIFLQVGSLAGTGSINATGGRSQSSSSSRNVGSGGGGRVALYVDNYVGFDVESQVLTFGASNKNGSWTPLKTAAGGTLYMHQPGMSFGELWIDGGSEAPNLGGAAITELPSLGTGSVVAFTPDGADAWVEGPAAFLPRWEGAWMALVDGSGVDLGVFRVAMLDGAGRALLQGAGTVTGAVDYRGEYHFDRVRVRRAAGLSVSDPLITPDLDLEDASKLLGPIDATTVDVSGSQVELQTDGLLTASAVTVRSGAVVKPAPDSDTLRLAFPGTLTVETGAMLDVFGLGYVGGTSTSPSGEAPVGVSGSQPDAGGSHAGLGIVWTGAGPAGEIYDSVYFPYMSGGGGAFDDDGSGDGLAGSGVIDLDVDTLVLDGELRTQGVYSTNAGRPSGAAGTVFVRAGSMSGSGTINALGGRSQSCSSSRNVGSGGGGRVALYVDSLSGFDLLSQIRLDGGSNKGCSFNILGSAGTGSAFVQTSSHTYGDLIVNAGPEGSNSITVVTLPTLGAGSVGVADPDAADPANLWIEPQDPAALPSLGVTGMWVRVNGSDFRILDQASDRRRILLADAAGFVQVGDAYEGVYKFDTVVVRNGATVEFLDTAEVGVYDVDASSQVITP